jgi:hypothetical protein
VIEAARARASLIVAPVGSVSSVSVEIDGDGLLIKAASDLSVAQQRAVTIAAHMAWVAVRVEPSLGPGQPTYGLVAVRWVLVEVGADLMSLLVSYDNSGLTRLPATSVREDDREIWVAVQLPDLEELRPQAVTLDFAFGYELVRLRAPSPAVGSTGLRTRQPGGGVRCRSWFQRFRSRG